MQIVIKNLAGTILCLILAVLAILLSQFVPIGAVAIAIVLGIIYGNTIRPGKLFTEGITFNEKYVLAFAIALLGVDLDFSILTELGLRSIFIIITAVTVTIFSSVLFGRIFKVKKELALLIGIGSGICGSSAIAATKDIIGAKEEEVGLSIAVVNFLGTIGIFMLPLIGTVVLHLTDINAGILIGNTLQAVGQVIAAGFSISEPAGQTAIIVKMARILMLTPVILILVFTFSGNRKENKGDGKQKNTVPFFIFGFILFSLIKTFDLLPETYISTISAASHYALIISMAAIGLKITFRSIVKSGRSALLIGSLLFVLQIVYSSSLTILLLN